MAAITVIYLSGESCKNRMGSGREPEQDPIFQVFIEDSPYLEVFQRDIEIPDWMTELDLEILGILASDLIFSPKMIAINIERSREGVSQRLQVLVASGLVEKVERGKYKITEKGMKFVKLEYRDITIDD